MPYETPSDRLMKSMTTNHRYTVRAEVSLFDGTACIYNSGRTIYVADGKDAADEIAGDFAIAIDSVKTTAVERTEP